MMILERHGMRSIDRLFENSSRSLAGHTSRRSLPPRWAKSCTGAR